MDVFGNDTKIRGCFHKFNKGFAGGGGAVLSLPRASSLPTSESFCSAINYTQKEKVSIVQCFQDTNHVYSFGHNPTASMLTATFTGFLVAKGGSSFSNVIGKYNSSYKASRVSESAAKAGMVVGPSTVAEGFVIGMKSSTQDSMRNLQNFTIELLIIEAQG